jgi:hypothetical protein
MKKILMIGSALALLSSSAYATQARLLALGMNETDNEGSYYIQDQRNVFLNPAYVNLYSDYAVFEWGSTGAPAGSTAATLSTSTAPKAQGGAFKKFGDFVYGVYMGNESNTSSLLRIAGTSSIATTNTTLNGGPKMLPTADNQVDFFVGSDMGIKWGADLTLAKNKDGDRPTTGTSKDSAGAIRLGVIGSNWDAHANISFNSESEATDTISGAGSVSQKFDGKLGLHVGGSVEALNGRVFGYVKHYGWEQTDSFANYAALPAPTRAVIGGQTGTVDGDFTSYFLGWGSSMEVNNGDHLYTSLTAKKTDINLKYASKSEVRHLIVPVTFGYEAKAFEWLTLRGSVVQNLWGTRDNKGIGTSTTAGNLNPVARQLVAGIYGGDGEATISGSTAVNAGATLTFGQLNVDGLIGMTSADRAGTNTAGSNGPGTNKGVLALDNLEAQVGVTYKF